MFIAAPVYQHILAELEALRETVAAERERHELQSEELALERGRREVLTQQTAVQKSMVDFLCARVNHLEAERVILLRHLTSVDIPTPVLRQEHPEPPIDPRAALASLSIFEDDPRHAPRGWHSDGSVNYDDAPTVGQQR